MGSARKILSAFFIGLVAGISPFLLIHILPALLDTTKQFEMPDLKAIVLTGLLLGAICIIMFSKDFDKKNPQDIFFYALGIPALLIATVSNISTKYDKAASLDAASSVVISQDILFEEEEVGSFTELFKTSKAVSSKPEKISFLWSSRALAQERGVEGEATHKLEVMNRYMVILGRYSTYGAAWKAYDKIDATRIRTEKYIPKELRVLQSEENTYYLTYTGPSTKEEAIKLYKLLKINDPKLAPKVLRMPEPPPMGSKEFRGNGVCAQIADVCGLMEVYFGGKTYYLLAQMSSSGNNITTSAVVTSNPSDWNGDSEQSKRPVRSITFLHKHKKRGTNDIKAPKVVLGGDRDLWKDKHQTVTDGQVWQAKAAITVHTMSDDEYPDGRKFKAVLLKDF